LPGDARCSVTARKTRPTRTPPNGCRSTSAPNIRSTRSSCTPSGTPCPNCWGFRCASGSRPLPIRRWPGRPSWPTAPRRMSASAGTARSVFRQTACAPAIFGSPLQNCATSTVGFASR
jgi:hypothetical protein